ncbi:MAG: hypothetical protein DWH94_09330 [Planctomycetota bacterium]|nr:MAG: hypothetical protein DWH94_09330 [Planctomycetota bacterium]
MLNPALLWFLPLAALPIVLHLLNLYRLRTIDLPTFRFLMEGYVQQRRRIQLVEWLLMLLRTAFVLLVIGAMSRPVVERFGFLFGGAGGKDVVFVVDASMTTGLVTDGTSGMHRMREAVRSASQRLKPSDFVTLIRAGMEPKVLYRAAFGDGKRLQAEIDSLEPDPGSAELSTALAEALSGPPRGARSIWIISDCERRAWRRLKEHPSSQKIPENVQLILVDAGSRSRVTNLAILGDPPRSQRPVVGLPVELVVRLEAAGIDEPIETKVTVVLDDEPVAQVSLTIAAGRVTTHSIAVVPKRAGVIHGRLELPADAFPEDDSLLFVLNVEPRVDVLVIAPPNVQPLSDPALFLRAALTSPQESMAGKQSTIDNKPTESQIAQSLDAKVIRSNALEERHVKEADVLIVADTTLDGTRMRWIRSKVEEGAGLVMISGPNSSPKADPALLAIVPGNPKEMILDFGKPVGDPNDERSGVAFGSVDLSHPVFAAFVSVSKQGGSSSASPFETLQFFRHVPLEVPSSGTPMTHEGPVVTDSKKNPVIVIARLSDGTPVFVETRIGRGRVIVAGVAVTPEWSNLPVHPSFVPIVLRSVQHVRPERPVLAAESVRPYEPAPIMLVDTWRRAIVQSIDPAGGRRAIETVAGDDRVTGALEDTRKIGYYEFDFQPPAESKDDPIRLGMVVNREIEAATIDHLSQSEVQNVFEPHATTYLAGTADDPVLHAQLTGRREIWRWLVWFTFAVIGIEFFLSTLSPLVPRQDGSVSRGWRGWLQRWNDWIGRAVGNVEQLT